MAKFKVTTLSVSGRGNNIYKSGDIVDGSKFNNVNELVKGGYISEIKASTSDLKIVKDDETTDLEDLSVKNLKALAKQLGLELTSTVKADIISEIKAFQESKNLDETTD